MFGRGIAVRTLCRACRRPRGRLKTLGFLLLLLRPNQWCDQSPSDLNTRDFNLRYVVAANLLDERRVGKIGDIRLSIDLQAIQQPYERRRYQPPEPDVRRELRPLATICWLRRIQRVFRFTLPSGPHLNRVPLLAAGCTQRGLIPRRARTASSGGLT